MIQKSIKTTNNTLLIAKERTNIMVATKRAYLSVEEISQEYLPMSKKKIREFVTKNLPYRKIGGRIYVPRQAIDDWLKENK